MHNKRILLDLKGCINNLHKTHAHVFACEWLLDPISLWRRQLHISVLLFGVERTEKSQYLHRNLLRPRAVLSTRFGLSFLLTAQQLSDVVTDLRQPITGIIYMLLFVTFVVGILLSASLMLSCWKTKRNACKISSTYSSTFIYLLYTFITFYVLIIYLLTVQAKQFFYW